MTALETIGLFALAVSAVELVAIVALAIRMANQNLTVDELRKRTTTDRDEIATLRARQAEYEWHAREAERDISELQKELTASARHCEDRIAELARQLIVMRNGNNGSNGGYGPSVNVNTTAHGTHGNAYGAAGGPDPSQTPAPAVAEARALAVQLASLFSLEEAQIFAAGLGFRWDELAGDTLGAKALSLAETMRVRGRLADLRAAIRRDRPNAT